MTELDEKIKCRGRKPSFLDTSLRLDGVLHILESLGEPTSFNKMVSQSKIKYRQSFIKYLNFCIEKNLITHEHTSQRYSNNSWTRISITDKGRKLLEMLK